MSREVRDRGSGMRMDGIGRENSSDVVASYSIQAAVITVGLIDSTVMRLAGITAL